MTNTKIEELKIRLDETSYTEGYSKEIVDLLIHEYEKEIAELKAENKLLLERAKENRTCSLSAEIRILKEQIEEKDKESQRRLALSNKCYKEMLEAKKQLSQSVSSEKIEGIIEEMRNYQIGKDKDRLKFKEYFIPKLLSLSAKEDKKMKCKECGAEIKWWWLACKKCGWIIQKEAI